MRSSIALLVGTLGLVAALPSITRTGKYLYDPDGNRFTIKGVAYQPQGQLAQDSQANQENGGFPEPSSFADPLSSPQNCTRDVPFLQQLGVNSIRVYSVNASLNHDECMSKLSGAGIYVLLDVSLPLNGSIDRSSPSWSTNLLSEYTKTIDAFNKYDNVLGYNIGNEVVNTAANTNSAPYVKAAARDVKAYLKGVGSSALVGYAAVDGEADFRNTMAEYMTCGEDAVSVDLYGLNNYEWCGNENVNSSNWATITAGFSNIPVATYMSEYGCITSPPRLWTEVAALVTSPVSDVFSGGMAFSYFPTSDGYGMVTFSSDGTSVQTSDDFNRLAAQYKNATGASEPSKDSIKSNTIDCPAENSSFIASSTLPPTPDQAVCDCVNQNAFSCVVKQSTANEPAIIGTLTDYACSLLGQSMSDANCNAISGNGSSGMYGPLAMCSPAIKLSYAMSAYYEVNPVDTSCDFGGNATLSPNKPNTAQDASSAASSCLAQMPSGGVFTPSPTSGAPSATGSSGGGGGSSAAAAASSSGAAMRGVEVGRVSGLGGMGLIRISVVSGVVGMVGMVMGGWTVL